MKRAIALVLSLLFVFTLIPASALAEGYALTATSNVGACTIQKEVVGADGNDTWETVASGSVIEAGTAVKVQAPYSADFKTWDITAGPDTLLTATEKTSSTVEFDMPAGVVTLKASYNAHWLKVDAGLIYINGAEQTQTAEGFDTEAHQTVSIRPVYAESEESGSSDLIFDYWTQTKGPDVVTDDNKEVYALTFRMPTAITEIEAVPKLNVRKVSIGFALGADGTPKGVFEDDSTADRLFQPGEKVLIKANPATTSISNTARFKNWKAVTDTNSNVAADPALDTLFNSKGTSETYFTVPAVVDMDKAASVTLDFDTEPAYVVKTTKDAVFANDGSAQKMLFVGDSASIIAPASKDGGVFEQWSVWLDNVQYKDEAHIGAWFKDGDFKTRSTVVTIKGAPTDTIKDPDTDAVYPIIIEPVYSSGRVLTIEHGGYFVYNGIEYTSASIPVGAKVQVYMDAEVGSGSTTTATNDIKKFASWAVMPADEQPNFKAVAASPFEYTMPDYDVTAKAIYEYKVTVSGVSGASTVTTDPPYGLYLVGTSTNYHHLVAGCYMLNIPSGTTQFASDTQLYLFTPAKITTANGSTLSFSNWQRVAGSGVITSPQSYVSIFTVGYGDKEIKVNAKYDQYALTVNGGTTESGSYTGGHVSGAHYAGEVIRVIAGQPSGGRVFTGWTFSTGVTQTADYDNGKVIEFIMPAGAVTATANFGPATGLSYTLTGAYIDMLVEPNQTTYALKELFEPGGIQVYYHQGGYASGNPVAVSDLRFSVIDKAGNVATNSGYFYVPGTYDLVIDFYVGSQKMAKTLVVEDLITVLDKRAEIIMITQEPNKIDYFYGEPIDTDGMKVELKYADHATNEYFSLRTLSDKEYTLVPEVVNIGDKDLVPYTYKDGNGTTQTGYRIQLKVAYNDPEQSDQEMDFVTQSDARIVWLYMKNPATDLSVKTLENKTEVSMQGDTIFWKVPLADTITRTITATVTGGNIGTTKAEIAGAMYPWTSSDPTVAKLVATDDPLVYKLVAVSAGETTITLKVRGNDSLTWTQKVLVYDPDNGVPTPMTGFTLTDEVLPLYVSSKYTLGLDNVLPTKADRTVTWTSSNPYYATVDENGVVEVLHHYDDAAKAAHGGNDLTITATAKYGALSASCVIKTMELDVDGMTLTPTTLSLYLYASYPLKAEVTPEGATDKTIKWSSTDSKIVSVDSEGKITANKIGTATIYATSSNEAVYKTCTVTVVNSVLLTSLRLNRTSATMGVNESILLTPSYLPETATTQSVTWISSRPTVATVNEKGKVTAVKEGATVISAVASDGSGLTASCVVTVTKLMTTSVTMSKTYLSLIEDDEEQIVAMVYPTNASNQTVKWTSSKPEVATVDADGTITAVGGGGAIITATATDGTQKYADCIVVVTPKIAVTGLSLNISNFDLLLNDTTLLKATVAPSNATYSTLTWASSNPSVATVSANGLVSGLAQGTSVITASAGGKSISITVTVVTKTFSVGTVVNCARRVNVRKNASGASAFVNYAYLGETYRVLDKTGSWYKIQYNATTQAYIWSYYLSAVETGAGYTSAGKIDTTTGTTATTGTTTTTTTTGTTAPTISITNCENCVNVRSGAGTTYTKLGFAFLDEVFPYTKKTGDWYEITYKGSTAYVSASFAQVN